MGSPFLIKQKEREDAFLGHTILAKTKNGGRHYGNHYQRYHRGRYPDIAPETAPAFIDIGMHCLGCPASRNETVEQACLVHDQPVEELVEKLNAIIVANRK